MAENIAVALASGVLGPVPADNGMVAEPVVLTPTTASDGDTGVYKCKLLKPDRVEGPLEYSISGQVVTFKATSALDDNNKLAARIIGYVK